MSSAEKFAEFTGFEIAHASDNLTRAMANADMSTVNGGSYASAAVDAPSAPISSISVDQGAPAMAF